MISFPAKVPTIGIFQVYMPLTIVGTLSDPIREPMTPDVLLYSRACPMSPFVTIVIDVTWGTTERHIPIRVGDAGRGPLVHPCPATYEARLR